MNFIAISPMFPKTYWNFCAKLKANGVTVLGIGDVAYDALSDELKNSLDEYYYVADMQVYDDMMRAVAFFIHKYGRIDWLESNNEFWLEQDARLRTDFNITSGFQLKDLPSFKLKSGMKKYYQKAGIPCARYHLVSDLAQGKQFIAEVGYPVIVKPDNGVGASATYKLNNDEELAAFYKELPSNQYIMEEFIDGTIYSYDAIVDQKHRPLIEATNYFPTPIMNIVNDKAPMAYCTLPQVPKGLAELGRKALKAFNVRSRFVHFEFFKLNKDHEGIGKKGDWAALEVNMRPAGGYTPDMLNFAYQCDTYQLYADMIVGKFTQPNPQNRHFYCVYASRFDGMTYKKTMAEVKSRYLANIVMEERMPDILSAAMGNDMFTARFTSFDEVEAFIRYVQE